MDRKDIKTIVCFLLWLLAAACTDKTDCCTVAPPPASGEQLVYIACEGNMGSGNSALSLYYPAKDSVYEDVFQSLNQQQLGDVFQSMTLIGDYYFLCINNSDRIVVIGKDDRKFRATISIPKPRYIQPVSPGKAFVSTLFSDKVYIIDPRSFGITGSFSLPAQNPEGMCLYGDRVFFCTWDTAASSLFGVDITTNQVVQTIQLPGAAPQEAVLDKEGMLWVLSGNAAKGKDAHLTRVDPVSGRILKDYAFPSGADPMRLEWSVTGDTLYFLEVNSNGGTQHNGVYRMERNDQHLPVQPFIPAQAYQYFWALGIEPVTGNVFVGDPRGFIQKGMVYVYRPDGSIVTQFATGVGPGHFYFSGY